MSGQLPAPEQPAELAAGLRLQLAGVRVRLGKSLALGGVDLEVAAGETVALFGPNGAGKTTLLRVAAGVLAPQAGSVRWPTAGGGDPRAAIGYVGHRTFFSDALSAHENLVFFGRMYGLEAAAAASRVRELLRAEGLILFADDPVGGFSRGMQQRLAICRALMHQPGLLLLDEPWSGLDADAGTRLSDRLRAHRAAGGSALLCSHDFEGALAVADRYVLLAGGRVREVGAAAPFRGRAQAFAERYREVVRAGTRVTVPVVTPQKSTPMAVSGRAGPSWGRACLTVTGRDLLLELRGRENLAAMGVFGLLVAVTFGFAFDPVGQDLRPIFAGVLLVALLFAGLLGMGRSFARELTNDALSGMAAAPCAPSAIFYGKCLANAAFLVAAEVVLVPIFFMLLLVPFPAHPAAFLGALALASLGLVAVATLTAAIAAHTRAGEVLQPLLALPLLSPVLIGAVRMAGGTVAGAGLAAARVASGAPWAGLLAAFDLAFLALPALLFDFVLEVSA